MPETRLQNILVRQILGTVVGLDFLRKGIYIYIYIYTYINAYVYCLYLPT